MDTILVERLDGGVVVCTFHRPEARNALNLSMVEEIRSMLAELRQDRSASALVLTGSEKVFVSGADIRELKERGKFEALSFINNGLFREIEEFPLPTVAAIRGWALGGGCELAAACDLRVAGKGARLGQPEVKLGILPGAGATYRLPELIGMGNARDLVLTGRIVDADEALTMGLVNRVVADEDVVETAVDLAAQIASNGRLAVRLAKMALGAGHTPAGRAGLYFEAAAQAVTFEDEEKHQRMRDFLESRREG